MTHTTPLRDEQELAGNWVKEGKTVRGDAITDRINWLVEHNLKKIAVGGGGWETLYQDPEDERYWERTYPQSEMQGGGPPKLQVLSPAQAKAKYQF